jgi:DNA-directed RNA polymerase II subunit RPB4
MNGTPNGIINTLPNGTSTSSTTQIPSFQPPPAPEIRTRERITYDEEAGSSLRLGDFQHVHCLSISEARLLVDAIFDARRKSGKPKAGSEHLTKMQEYMDTYARFKGRATISELEGLMAQHPYLDSFEAAQLTTLCPGDADEAKTLIPSLVGKIDDAGLQELLVQINQHRDGMFVE